MKKVLEQPGSRLQVLAEVAELREGEREESRMSPGQAAGGRNGSVECCYPHCDQLWEARSLPFPPLASLGCLLSTSFLLSPFIPMVATPPLASHSLCLGTQDSPDAGTVTMGLSSLWGCCVKPGQAQGAAAAPHCSCGTCPTWAVSPGPGPRRTFSAPGWRCCCWFSCSCQKGQLRAGPVLQ